MYVCEYGCVSFPLLRYDPFMIVFFLPPDTFYLEYNYEGDGHGKKPVRLNYNNIAWDSDVNVKFNNPDNFNDTLPPPNWQINITDLEGGYRNESFIVWMRTAAFSTFRKLHSRVEFEVGTVFDKGLPKGAYTIYVDYSILFVYRYFR